MLVQERTVGDLKELRRRARKERSAERKDRFMVVTLAIGGRETEEIQEATGRSRGFVQRWVYAYRDGGIEAIKDRPRGGSVATIGGDKLE